MRKLLVISLIATGIIVSNCTEKEINGFVLVKGGAFINTKSNLYGTKAIIPDFYMGKYEVTQKEWIEVMGSNPSRFKGDHLPVEMVSWYDCIEYCNKKSLKEGLTPFYQIDQNQKDPINKNDMDSVKWSVTINKAANGFRLPTEAEWEYAASGGQLSKSYLYCGSNDVDEVAWSWRNSGDTLLTGTWFWTSIEKNHCKTQFVGNKKPNELGLYDMSGNVREWCEDWYQDHHVSMGFLRAQRGGGWIGAEHCCELSYRGSFEANGKGPDQGLRVCLPPHSFKFLTRNTKRE